MCSEECFLFCDNVLVADIFCNNRQWTDISQDPEVSTGGLIYVSQDPEVSASSRHLL